MVLIPALCPDKRMLYLVENLKNSGFFKIVVVDDGSGNSCQELFHQAEKYGCIVVNHKENLGKGAALKTGLRTAEAVYGSMQGFITVDADGQHLVEDINRVAEELARYPESLVLGVRRFHGRQVPFRSRFGNRVTSAFFRLISGKKCPDTQTGLRGIPGSLFELALKEEGERYEYEMNFLMDAAEKTELRFVEITTVYEGKNESSHFRPLADSVRVYGRVLRFLLASSAGAAADYFFFYLFTRKYFFGAAAVFPAAVLARLGSGMLNFWLNRCYSFRSRKAAGKELYRYGILFAGQMVLSAALVSVLNVVVPMMYAKLLIDTVLFFISFRIQKNWVFYG